MWSFQAATSSFRTSSSAKGMNSWLIRSPALMKAGDVPAGACPTGWCEDLLARTQRGRQGSNSELKKNGCISRAGKAVPSMMEGCPLRREAIWDVLKNAVEKLAKRPTG